MPRRTILSDAELAGLLALPDTEAETIRRYTFSDADLAIIAQHRGPAAKQMDAQTLENVRQQVHAIPGQEAAELWRSDCQYCMAMAYCDELGFIHAYLPTLVQAVLQSSGQGLVECPDDLGVDGCFPLQVAAFCP